MKSARFQYWRNKQNWSFYELAFLLKGYEPVALSKVDSKHYPMIKMALDDMKVYATDYCRTHRIVLDIEFGTQSDLLDQYHPTSTLLKWVNGLEGIKIHEKFITLIKTDQKTKSTASNKSQVIRERKSLLVIIGALSKELKLNLSKPYAAAKVIEKMLELDGLKLGTSTIAKKLEDVLAVQEERKT